MKIPLLFSLEPDKTHDYQLYEQQLLKEANLPDKEFTMFSDSSVQAVGSWHQVIQKCLADGLAPVQLVYESANKNECCQNYSIRLNEDNIKALTSVKPKL